MVSGALGIGDRLATVRQLARDLALAPGTVAKGYQLLEADGVIETHGRRGTFVAAAPIIADAADELLRSAARRYLAEGVALGVPAEAAASVVAQLAKSLAGAARDPELLT